MARQLEPISDAHADRILAVLVVVFFCIFLALCSMVPNPEPGLPSCRPDRPVHERCQP